MIDSADIRKMNLHRIRTILWSGEWKTKQQTALETGLSVATCNTLLNELANAGEVVSEKIRLKEVGPGALRYRINEAFESILCVWFERIGSQDILTQRVLSVTGRRWGEERKCFETLTPVILQTEIQKVIEQFPNISCIMVGIPGIAEHGVIRHCDIPELEHCELVRLLTEQSGKTVHMENDMYFKVFGYYQKHSSESGVVTLANFPQHLLPGTATVHDGMVIKGHNQFAGMVGFLPFGRKREELLKKLQPDTCREIVSQAVTSLIAVLNPGTILLTGDLLDETCTEWIRRECLRWIPEAYMPELRYCVTMDDHYIEGMYQKALQLKGRI